MYAKAYTTNPIRRMCAKSCAC